MQKKPDITWRIINDVLNPKSSDSPELEITLNNNKISGTPLAEEFNQYFTNVAPTTLGPIDAGITDKCTQTIFLEPTDNAEVCRTFIGLKNSKATDIDGFQVCPVKYVIDIIAPYLTYIFNLVFESGSFPSAMKTAKVSVIFKGGDKNDLGNYRPISILPIFSKGLEKIIFSRLNGFLMKHNALNDCQHGFRKGRSTETALLIQKELIINSLEKGNLVLGIFIDYSKNVYSTKLF